MTPKKNKGILIYIAVSAAILFGLLFLFNNLTKPRTTEDYGTIMGYFDNLEIAEYKFDLNNGNLTYRLKGEEEIKTYNVPNVSLFVNEIQNDAYNYREEYNKANPDAPLLYNLVPIKDRSILINMIPSLLILVLMVVLFFFMMKQANGGGKIGNFGKSNAKSHLNNAKKATFADVAGADEEKEELKEIVDFLKDSSKYNEIGARVPKGVLLLGPPGTGKTLLARAVAGEAGVPFFSISGSDFVEMFVGVGASRVRDLFGEAKKAAPAIIFIDEIDAVGRQRGAGLGGGHD